MESIFPLNQFVHILANKNYLQQEGKLDKIRILSYLIDIDKGAVAVKIL